MKRFLLKTIVAKKSGNEFSSLKLVIFSAISNVKCRLHWLQTKTKHFLLSCATPLLTAIGSYQIVSTRGSCLSFPSVSSTFSSHSFYPFFFFRFRCFSRRCSSFLCALLLHWCSKSHKNETLRLQEHEASFHRETFAVFLKEVRTVTNAIAPLKVSDWWKEWRVFRGKFCSAGWLPSVKEKIALVLLLPLSIKLS